MTSFVRSYKVYEKLPDADEPLEYQMLFLAGPSPEC